MHQKVPAGTLHHCKNARRQLAEPLCTKGLPSYVDPIETARRAEADRRADYDRRVETARREEYDRRMEYDFSVLCQIYDKIRKVSTAEDFELQVRRLDEMGKIIDTLTTMLTKPPQPQGSATEKITLMRSCSQTQELHVMRAPFIGNLLALRLVLYTQIKELLPKKEIFPRW